MNNIEKIKAEIKRLYEKYRDAFHQHKDDYHLGLYDGLDMAIRVINSLPEEKPSEDLEQPDNEDIDKVAQELYEHLYELKRRNSVPTNLYDKQEIIDLWKAAYKKGYFDGRKDEKEQMMKKAIGWIKWNNDNGGCLFDGWRKDFIKTMEDEK